MIGRVRAATRSRGRGAADTQRHHVHRRTIKGCPTRRQHDVRRRREHVRRLGKIAEPILTARAAKVQLARRRHIASVNDCVVELRALKAFSRWYAGEHGSDDELAAMAFPRGTKPAPGRIASEDTINKLLGRLQASTAPTRGAERGGNDDSPMAVAGWRSTAMPIAYRRELAKERAAADYQRLCASAPQPTIRIKSGPRKAS